MMALLVQSSVNGLKIFALVIAAFYFFNWKDTTDSSGTKLQNDPAMRPTKALVMASGQQSELWWIPESPPSWYHFIYVVDDPNAPLTVPEWKGGEAIVYLSYMIDNYYSLPEIVLFHIDDESLYNLPMSARYELSHLREDSVRKQGYLNMHCERTCDTRHYLSNYTVDIEQIAYAEQNVQFSTLLREILGDDYEMPEIIRAPCCGQFAASRDAILSRPREFWEKLRSWILETDADDQTVDMLMESTWHIWFGKPAEHCVEYNKCICDTVGVDAAGKSCI